MKIGFLGRTEMLYNTVLEFLHGDHEVSFIGTCKASPEYRITEYDFQKLASDNHIPFFCDTKLKNHMDILQNSADVVLSMNWLNIITGEIIDLFPYGILNAHPGDLPKYRGNACPNWAILNGEKFATISIHYMNAGELDSGRIILKEDIELAENTTITDVYNKLYYLVPKLFLSAVDLIQDKKFVPLSQNESLASRCYPRMPRDSFIDWRCTCEEIEKNIRASTIPFLGAYSYYGDVKFYIHSCRVEYPQFKIYAYPGQVASRDVNTGEIRIIAKDGYICFNTVVVNNKEIKASELLKSTRIRLNYCLEDEVYELWQTVKELEEELCNVREAFGSNK